MDLKELLVSSLATNSPVQHVQYVNSKNKIYAVEMEVAHQTLTVKDVKCLTNKHKQKLWPKPKGKGSYKVGKKFKMCQTKPDGLETGEVTDGVRDTDNHSEFSLSLTCNEFCQTDDVIKFDKWTCLEDSAVRNIGEQTMPIEVNSLALQTSEEYQESRYVQADLEVLARGNQTDFESFNKNEQTELTMDFDKYEKDNEMIISLAKQLVESVNERNFNVNLESMGNSLQIPSLLKDMELTGAKAFLEQKRWGLKNFRLWSKHHRYLKIYKKARFGSILEDRKELVAASSQTDHTRHQDTGIQTISKQKKWYEFGKQY